jgi:hypothetical protein
MEATRPQWTQPSLDGGAVHSVRIDAKREAAISCGDVSELESYHLQ